MQITKVVRIDHLSITCMTPGCTNSAEYRATILENETTLNVLVCHKCYIEGRCLDFLYPAAEKKANHF